MKGQSRSSSTPTKRSNSREASKRTRKWTKAEVLRELRDLADPEARAKMSYFGVNVPKAHGISAPALHSFARHMSGKISHWRSSCGPPASTRQESLPR